MGFEAGMIERIIMIVYLGVPAPMTQSSLPTDNRLVDLQQWLMRELGLASGELSVASADASFRRYFRWQDQAGGVSRIVMDAPPEHESLEAYLDIARLLRSIDVHVPEIFAVDQGRGYVLLEDLGTTPYLAALREPGRAPALYASAQLALSRMQQHLAIESLSLPLYDAATLQREMDLMPEWFCARHLGLKLTPADEECLQSAMSLLIQMALEQPRVFVHRDYHSRNLMVLARGGPGVIDFQDAVIGPIAYDLVSLFKDCYISWPRADVEHWVRDYRSHLLACGRRDLAGSAQEFLCWFDFMGVQRHLKVLGIFARLHWRDGKSGYLADLPLTLEYLLDTCARYASLQSLARWLSKRVVPLLSQANACALGAPTTMSTR
jgi:aminoglycoside/choline kinase family phosphotransferase